MGIRNSISNAARGYSKMKKVAIIKWPHQIDPTPEAVAAEMASHGYKSYDLQTIAPWFVRSRHAHDFDEIRGAVEGVTTFHFDDQTVTVEAGDILFIPAGVSHEVRTHNSRTFTAYKGSTTGTRSVTELGDGKGSIEDLAREKK